MSEKKKEDIGRQSIGGYVSQKEKGLYRTVAHTQSLVISVLVVALLSLVASLISMIMLATGATPATKAEVKWTECELDNYLGYSVQSDWITSAVGENSVMFQVSDSDIIAVESKSVLDINANSEVKCTIENLDTYVREVVLANVAVEGTSVKQVVYDTSSFDILGQPYTVYNVAQQATYEGTTTTAYLTMVCFVRDNYLYTFGETTQFKNYMSDEFKRVLSSIRVIPESERITYDFSDVTLDESMLEDYNDLAEDKGLVTSATTTAAVPETDMATTSS